MTDDSHISICHCPDSLDVLTDHTDGATGEIMPQYHRCINCSELGRSCSGQKLESLGTSETVRTYHKLMRSVRGITLSRICAAAPQLGHGTVHDYFARGGPDPKWATVAAIDVALVAICGDRVGQDPLETPCPSAYADIHSRNEALSQRLTEAETEIARLTQALTLAEESHGARLTAQRSDLQTLIDMQAKHIAELESEKADYLRRIDAKSQEIASQRQEIRELNQTVLRITGDFATKTVGLVDRILSLTK